MHDCAKLKSLKLVIVIITICYRSILNQEHASGRRSPGFLKLLLYGRLCMCVSVYLCVFACVCPSPWPLITNGIIWHGIWLNKFHRFHMAAIVGIISRRGLIIEAHQLNKSKLALCKP